MTPRRATSPEAKLAACVRLLDSPHAGEAAAALTAVQRVLKSAGLDLHELANRIEKSNGASISEADLQRVYEQEGPVHMRASAGHEDSSRLGGDAAGQEGITTMKLTDDTTDMDSLWLDPSLGDGLVDTHFHSVAIGKPKDFFRVNPDPLYRRRAEVYTHKVDGVIDEQCFILSPAMRGQIEEAQHCTIVTAVYRDGTPRLWALKLPKGSGRDNEAWSTARAAARAAMTKWVKLVWVGRAYQTREAQPGYAPEPDFSKLPPFDELVKLAFGEHGVIRDGNHPIARDLLGAAPPHSNGDDDDGLS